MELQLITWNVHFRDADALDALKPRADALDVVLLQEVKNSAREAYRARLASLGFGYFEHGGGDGPTKRYGNVTATKRPITRIPTTVQAPFPQLLVHVRLEVAPAHTLELINVHAPNGSNNGWDKIRTLRGARRIVEDMRPAPVVVAGDFNEPRYLPGGLPVRSFAWRKDTAESDWQRLKDQPWQRKNARGDVEAEPRGAWDDAVGWYFTEDSGLQHAHWATHGRGTAHVSHRTSADEGGERWFDHLFVSKALRVRESAYLDELCAPLGPSDHSALWAKVEV